METATSPKASSKKREDSREVAYPRTYIWGLVIGMLLLVPAFLMALHHQISGWQLPIFRVLNDMPNALKTPALLITEGLGAAYPIAACVMIPALFKRFKLAWRFFVAAGAAGVVMEVAKHLAKEPRPIVMLHGNLHARAVETGLTSFPSGHAAIATALAMTLWLVLPRSWRWLTPLWILLVLLSRVYLGVHAPVDVIGGFAIGLIVCSVLELLPKSVSGPLHLDGSDKLLDPGF